MVNLIEISANRLSPYINIEVRVNNTNIDLGLHSEKQAWEVVKRLEDAVHSITSLLTDV